MSAMTLWFEMEMKDDPNFDILKVSVNIYKRSKLQHLVLFDVGKQKKGSCFYKNDPCQKKSNKWEMNAVCRCVYEWVEYYSPPHKFAVF